MSRARRGTDVLPPTVSVSLLSLDHTHAVHGAARCPRLHLYDSAVWVTPLPETQAGTQPLGRATELMNGTVRVVAIRGAQGATFSGRRCSGAEEGGKGSQKSR